MKLYKTTVKRDEEFIRATWQGTQADARKIRIEFEQPFKEIKPLKRPKVLVEEVDVPTNKEGLLAFLNGK